MKKAVCLSSGGLDSTTVIAIAKSENFEVYSLSFDYGQRHRFELQAAEKVAKELGVVDHQVQKINLRAIGGSALTADIDVPKDRAEDDMTDGIPITYVPARNLIFLSFATAWAEVLNASHIFIGVNAIDYSGYPDCRPEFIKSFQSTAQLATAAGVENSYPINISAPLIMMTKAEIIQTGVALGIDYSITHSCYDPDEQGRACGACDSCLLRAKGFADAGIPDPTKYRN